MNSAFQWSNSLGPVTPLETKSANQSVFALHAIQEFDWSPFEGAAGRGYGDNAVVYRCVRMIAEAASSIRWMVREEGIELDTHPVLELLNQPCETVSGATLMERIYSFLQLSGNAYCQLVSVDDEPRELYDLHPDHVTVMRGSDGWPVAYEYEAGNVRKRFDIEEGNSQVLALSLFNPKDEFCGQSPLQAAGKAVEIHDAACRWNKALLDNSARPSGALVYSASENANLTDEQFTRLKQELEEGYTGAVRAGRPMVLEGGLDWKAMGYSPRDMDFMEAKNGAAREIAFAFGVPPMLLGIPGDNTYANYKEANRAFWLQTVLPLVNRVCESMGNWLSPHFGSAIALIPNLKSHEVFEAETERRWKRAASVDFLTINEKRQLLGFPPLPDEHLQITQPVSGES